MDHKKGPVRLFSDTTRVQDRNRSVGETAWAYLENSAFRGDDRIRDQLQQMVFALPTSHQYGAVNRLKDGDHRRVNEVVAELAVHQAFVDSGRTDIEVAPSTPDGESDYRLSELGLHFEVTRIGESNEAHGDRQRKYQMLESLNQLDCGRFSLNGTLHSGRSQPSVKRVRNEIRTWLAGLDAAVEREALEASPSTYRPHRTCIEFDDWSIDLVAHPLTADAPSETVIARLDEPFTKGPVTVESIRGALAKKRQQHRRLTEPLVIGLDISQGMVTPNVLADAFYGDRPLVGWDHPIDRGALWPTPERSGCPAGALPRVPSIVGVLVLDHLHLTGLDAVEATFWLPPDASGPVLSGPWSTARWVPGAGSGADIDITSGRQKYFLNFP